MAVSAHSFRFIGRGLYTIPEAHRLTGIPTASIRRWTSGYRYRYKGTLVHAGPVIGVELAGEYGAPAIDFADLAEVLFLQRFLTLGVSWKTIRIAVDRVREIVGMAHPFSHKRFTTDGKSILAEVAREEQDHILLNLITDQIEFEELIAKHFVAEIDFGGGDTPKRWYPLGKNRRVVVDPNRFFGAPYAERSPTAALWASFSAEQSFELVADMYDVAIEAVIDAVEYEASRETA